MTRDDLERLRLPELQQRFHAAVGEATRSQNRTFLIRRIREALAMTKAASTKTSAPERRTREVAAPPSPRRPFASASVDELRAAYASIVGRPTDSTDRRYLLWKIREAERGRVPRGARATRTPSQQAVTPVRILPLRLDVAAVAKMDAAWRNAGMKSRMEFVRKALSHYLRHMGLRDSAALFA